METETIKIILGNRDNIERLEELLAEMHQTLPPSELTQICAYIIDNV